MVSHLQLAVTVRPILQSLNSARVTCANRFAFPNARGIPRLFVFPPEPGIGDSDIHAEVQNCLALARRAEAAAAAGHRLEAARAAVELVKAYDSVLEKVQLLPLSSPEQQRVREHLAPVTELLRKYRLR